MRFLILSLVVCVGWISLLPDISCRKKDYAKWETQFHSIGKNPRVVASIDNCLDDLGLESTRKLLTDMCSRYDCFAFDGDSRFAQIHRDGHRGVNGRGHSDRLYLVSLGTLPAASWHGPLGMRILSVSFDKEMMRVKIYGIIDPKKDSIPKEQPIEVKIKWPSGKPPNAGIFFGNGKPVVDQRRSLCANISETTARQGPK